LNVSPAYAKHTFYQIGFSLGKKRKKVGGKERGREGGKKEESKRRGKRSREE
jgi:hypothetical protein